MATSRKDDKGRALRKGESQRKDKRYIYQYTDPNGKRHVIYANDLLELREKESKVLRDELDGLQLYADGKVNLNFAFDRYLDTKVDLRDTTRANYKYIYDHCVRETFGRRLLKEIRYSDVKFFYNSLIRERGMKTDTVDSVHTCLHPTFQMAVRDLVIRTNPSDGVMAEIKKSHKDAVKRHALTIEQQQAFLGYVSDHIIYDHWLNLFILLFGTGLRIGEAIGLRWDDLDFENRVIDVNHSVSFYRNEHGKCTFHVSLPKTEAGCRIVPMMDQVEQALRNEYDYQLEIGFNETEIMGMSGFIFQNRNGGLYVPSLVNRATKRIYTDYNAQEILEAKRQRRDAIIIPHFSCHHIRHTFCTRLCEKETNIKAIQSIMGHKDIKTTMDVYAEATDASKRDAINIISSCYGVF